MPAAPSDVNAGPAGEWMMGLHRVPQPLVQDVRVYLRGGDVGVTEHLLNAAQIGPVREQVGGEGVSQHVWRHALGADPGCLGQFLQHLAEAATGQMPFDRP